MGSGYPELHAGRITVPRVIFRFFTGRPLDGIRRTDSIFIRRGKHSMDPSGHATKWAYLAGYQRLLFRLAGVYVFAWTVAILFAGLIRWMASGTRYGVPAWTQDLTPGQVLARHMVLFLVLGGPIVAWYGVREFGLRARVPVLAWERKVSWSRTKSFPWVRVSVRVRVQIEEWVPWSLDGRRAWTRTYVRPVALAADQVLGTGRHVKDAHKWVRVPRTFREIGGDPVAIALPASFTGADKGTKDRLVRAVGSRLGLRSPVANWELEGDHPRVLISPPPAPPDKVLFEEVRETMENLPEYTFLLGLSAGRVPFTVSLQGDSPHIGLSAGSGAGKSTLLTSLVMTALRWGWGVIILDWKEASLTQFEDMPGVLYVRDIEDIHDTAERLETEVEARKKLYRLHKSLPGKSKVLVICEEMNVTARRLTKFWERLRATADTEEKKSMPLRSPAFDGLEAGVFTGRQLDVFLVYIAQRFSTRVTNGNADLRECFGIRGLARATTSAWKMLAPQIRPIPEATVEPGDWDIVIGSECTRIKSILITDEEAREFASGGKENPSSPLSGSSRPTVPSGTHVDHELGETLGDRPAVPSQRRPEIDGEVLATVDARKLSEMVEGLSHLGITLDVLRHAAKDQASGFPGAYGGTPNKGYTYDFRAVLEWARRRHASASAKKEK